MRCLCIFLSLSLLATSNTGVSDDWPQFRGPSGDGLSQAIAPPLTFDDAEDVVWKTSRPPIAATQPDYRKAFSTPLLIDVAEQQQLVVPGAQWVAAYEPTTGKEIWRASFGNGFSNAARPVFGHGIVYICTGFMRPELWAIRVDGEGDVTVLRPGREYDELAKSNIKGRLMATPAVTNNGTFIRTDTHLYRFE